MILLNGTGLASGFMNSLRRRNFNTSAAMQL
jgi:hypothetical protein